MTFSSSLLPRPGFVERRLVPRRADEPFAPARVAPAAAAPRAAEPDPGQQIAEAFASGFEQGRARAAEEQAEVVRGALCALEEAARELRARDARAQAALAPAALELAVAVAERILRREIDRDLGSLAPCLEEALAALRPTAATCLALAPADLAAVEAGAADAVAKLAETWNARLVADPALAPGEARVESGGAQVELVWDRVVERFRRTLALGIPLQEQRP